MTTAPQPLISVADYLESQQHTDIKHEYFAGQVTPMSDFSDAHCLIAGALFAALHRHARQKRCQLFASRMKVRIDHDGDSYFYYPDLVASCDPQDRDPLFTRSPCLIVEVISPSSERIDTREKLLAYRLLPSLREYLLLRQDRVHADLYTRQGDGRWQHQVIVRGSFTLQCLDAEVDLAEVYADLDQLG
ncbi:MAG: Uma2 family endonuclease [Pseudomonadota bacterium]|nr:Uma2 family endonuclease [Pseudomonadota bacterium]